MADGTQSSRQFEIIPFHGATLEAVRDGDDVWVVVKRTCEAIGVSVQSQLQKLNTKPWAVIRSLLTTGPDGKTYEMSCLHIDCLPMWLGTINADHVSESVRPRLLVFQRECAKVLRDHFFGQRQTQAIVPAQPVGAPLQVFRAMVAALEDLEAKTVTIQAAQTEIAARVEEVAAANPKKIRSTRMLLEYVRKAFDMDFRMAVGEIAQKEGGTFGSVAPRLANQINKALGATRDGWKLAHYQIAADMLEKDMGLSARQTRRALDGERGQR